MPVRKLHVPHPDQMVGLSTQRVRDLFLVPDVFAPDQACLTHTHVERMILGGVMPVNGPVRLDEVPELAKGPLLALREAGIINVGGPGRITVDGVAFPMAARDGLYVPRETTSLVFESESAATPAKYYLVSTPAHARHATVHIPIAKANPMPMGSPATSNERTIYQYVNPDVCRSSQLLMGLTALKEGSVWNTMPCHMHERRSEVYFYFDMKPDARVFHFIGAPAETRHVVVANEQLVITPPWSIHSGVGTGSYAFIWAMGGENQDYKDMDAVPTTALR